jgi:acyl carrier protein
MNAPRKAISAADIEHWLKHRVAAALRIPVAEVSRTVMFPEMGIDSLAIVQIAGEAGNWLECAVDPNVAYDHPTIEELAAHLATLGRR